MDIRKIAVSDATPPMMNISMKSNRQVSQLKLFQNIFSNVWLIKTFIKLGGNLHDRWIGCRWRKLCWSQKSWCKLLQKVWWDTEDSYLFYESYLFISKFFLNLLMVDIFRLSMRLEVECRILFPLTFLGFCICYWIYYWPVITNIIWSNFCHIFFANFGFIRILLSLV